MASSPSTTNQIDLLTLGCSRLKTMVHSPFITYQIDLLTCRSRPGTAPRPARVGCPRSASPPSRTRHLRRLCQVQARDPRRARRRSRPRLSLAACVADRPEPATCPCSQGANSSTRRAQRDWSVGDPRRHTQYRRPDKNDSHPPTLVDRWCFHSQPARRQSRGGKGRWHCLVNVPLFFKHFTWNC